MDVEDTGQRLDRSARSRVDLETAGNGDFDLAGGQIKNHCHPPAAARLAGDHTLEARQRARLAEEYSQPSRSVGDDRLEWLDLLGNQPSIVLFAACIDRDHQRLA